MHQKSEPNAHEKRLRHSGRKGGREDTHYQAADEQKAEVGAGDYNSADSENDDKPKRKRPKVTKSVTKGARQSR